MASVGCGVTSGFLRDSMTQTQIQGPGFRIVKTGLSSTVHTGAVFCSIPTGEGELYRRGMEQLNAQAKLYPNQMLVNLREDVKTAAYLVFYCKYTLTLSADVIEFSDAFATNPPAEAGGRAPVERPESVEDASPAAAPPPPATAPVTPATAPVTPAASSAPLPASPAPAAPARRPAAARPAPILAQ